MSARDDPRIAHPHAHLLDVFASTTTFIGGPGVDPGSDELAAVPTVAAWAPHRPPPPGAPSIVPTPAHWRAQFGHFSLRCLDGLDWTGVAMCGSAALIPLLPLPPRPDRAGPPRPWTPRDDFNPALRDDDAAWARLVYHHLAPPVPVPGVDAGLHLAETFVSEHNQGLALGEHYRVRPAELDVVRQCPYSTADIDLFLYALDEVRTR